MESDVSGDTGRKSHAKSARPWPNHARALADDLQTVLEGIGEQSMMITAQADHIDTVIMDAITDIGRGDGAQAIERLQTVIGKTRIQRACARESFGSVTRASKRIEMALAGKYK
jgi:hypothetical protein